jgi:hypothetical protein
MSPILATSTPRRYPLASLTSDRIIVRASNPAQFETSCIGAASWSPTADSLGIYFNGNVGINTKTPNEALCVNGNVTMTGALVQPSDRRVKTNLQRCDRVMQLSNLRRLQLYTYDLRPEWASVAGVDDADAVGHTGFIAQEVSI